jgi:hypothetical protein
MTKLTEIAHFLYSMQFWYNDPFREIKGISEEQLFWVPQPVSLPIVWQVGHIAHRERFHIGLFLQGISENLIPPQFEVFGPDWHSVQEIRHSIGSLDEVFNWVRSVREASLAFIDSLSDDDIHKIPPSSVEGLSIGQWLFITAAHTALHIGKIQSLRAMIENEPERAC